MMNLHQNHHHHSAVSHHSHHHQQQQQQPQQQQQRGASSASAHLGIPGDTPPLPIGNIPLGFGFPQSPQLPQLLLTSGQLGQGIQGAQVLISTPQGISSQTILTIPVSQQLPTNLTLEQLLQSIQSLGQNHGQSKKDRSGSQEPTLSDANHVLSNVPNLSPSKLTADDSRVVALTEPTFLDPILLNSHLLATGAQQLLSIQPQLMALQQQQQALQARNENPFMDRQQQSSARMESEAHLRMRNREMSRRRPLNGHEDSSPIHLPFSSRSPNVAEASAAPTDMTW